MRWMIAPFLVLLSAGTAMAAGPPAVVSARTVLATNAVHPGQTAKLAVLARIEPGYHINDHKPSLDYLIPAKVEFDASPTLKVEKVVYPQGKMVKFDFLDSPISVYEGEIRLGSLLKLDSSVKPGSYPLRGKFTYQACNDHACLPPTSVPFETSLRVARSSVPLKPANSEIFRTIDFN
ncbi:MAG TPA: protein-disulfide reductase DsbD domain-containing protein [Terriglobia bacterium]|nr:protein-disulfide reductase DsbD domain-containing protein [Terriglobia bacterium]